MRAVNLAKIAAEAEILRIQHMLKRQGMRTAFGLVAVIFALGVLVLAHVAGWQIFAAVRAADLRDPHPTRRRSRACSDLWHLGCKIIAEPR
jgi:hypothetical protein